MLIGYMRVSKADGSQNIAPAARRAHRPLALPAHIYEDRASGQLDARPGLDAALKALRREDTLIVWKLDRLGRNLRHLINVVHDLTKRSIGFKVLTGHGASIDTTTPSGNLVFGIFAALAEFERDLISGANQSRPCLGSCSRTQRWSALQNDGGKIALGDGRHGAKGNESDRIYAANWLLPGKRSTGTSRQMGRCARMG